MNELRFPTQAEPADGAAARKTGPLFPTPIRPADWAAAQKIGPCFPTPNLRHGQSLHHQSVILSSSAGPWLAVLRTSQFYPLLSANIQAFFRNTIQF